MRKEWQRGTAQQATPGGDTLCSRSNRLTTTYCVIFLRVYSESFCGSPANFSLTKSPVSTTSSRPYLLIYGVPRHPDVAGR